jgi:hypothetical protein
MPRHAVFRSRSTISKNEAENEMKSNITVRNDKDIQYLFHFIFHSFFSITKAQNIQSCLDYKKNSGIQAS